MKPTTPIQRIQLNRLWRSRRNAWLLALLLGLITLLATVGLLALSGWFISAAAYAGLVALSAAYSFNYFVPAAIIRFFAIIRTAGRYGERLASHHAALALLADLRSGIFARLLRTPTHRTHWQAGQQMHRLTSDVDTLNEWPLATLLPWGWAILLLSAYAVFLACVAPPLLRTVMPPLLITGIAVPLFAMRRCRNLAACQAQHNEARRSALLTPLSALTALLQWGRWQDFADTFRRHDQTYNNSVLTLQQLSSRFTLIQQLFITLAIGLLLWQGAAQLAQHKLSVPVLLALLLGILGLSEILLPLVGKAAAWGNSVAARDRLNQLLSDTPPTDGTITAPETPWHISLEQLSATQPDALNGPQQINIDLYSGDTLIINGASGAGKSTLLDVLAGELLPTTGNITLNATPYPHYLLQGHIGYLAQQWMIFDLTLAENLRLGMPDADEAALWHVLSLVSLDTWAKSQPKQLNTPLGEYGAAVSGGQARRIALARLLLKPYPLLLLDEPFAGLDAPLRQQLYDTLRRHQQHGILVIVSHHELNWGADIKQLHIT